jgi:hypothetical protein
MPGYADMLRAVGWLLDCEEGHAARIELGDELVIVSWESAAGLRESRAFENPAGIDRLGEAARAADSLGERSELLRTLGQNLDHDSFPLSSVRERGGFEVVGQRDDGTLRRWYSLDELRDHSRQRKFQRRRFTPRGRSWWRRLLPFG